MTDEIRETGDQSTIEHDVEIHDGNGHVPPSVFDDLREAYAEGAEQADRTITMQIRPGRFGTRLAVRYGTGPWDDYRKRAQRAERRSGGGVEGNLNFMAQTMVACCQTILYRPTDQTELLPMDETNPPWRGTPVKFDDRLCEALGIDPPRENLEPSARWAQIARLVFQGNEGALIEHFGTLDAFLKEEIPGDDPGEDDEGAGNRPT